MKRKKSKKELFSELHRNGKTTSWIKNNNDSISLKFSSKAIAFILVFMLLIAYTKADEIECPAGYSCENDLKTPCEVGWYSLKGETTCSRCKPGKLVNFQFSSTRRNYMPNHDRSSNQMQRWRVFTMVLHKMRALSSR